MKRSDNMMHKLYVVFENALENPRENEKENERNSISK